jgi:aminopeptidase N
MVVHSKFEEASVNLLADFYQKWSHDTLVVNQWFAVQASDTKTGAVAKVEALMLHEAFDLVNPPTVRSLIAVFCMRNLVNFHAEDGTGYSFLADQIIILDKSNPQMAARLLGPLTKWARFNKNRQTQMRAQLQRILDSGSLSADVYEVVSKSLI